MTVKYCLFRRSRSIYREQYSGFSKCGRPVSAEIQVFTGTDRQSYLLYAQYRRIYEFYKEKMMFLDAKPNAAHKKLAELEKAGKLKAIITQNIDGLHQAAGSKNVYEIHGSIHRNYCTKMTENSMMQHM